MVNELVGILRRIVRGSFKSVSASLPVFTSSVVGRSAPTPRALEVPKILRVKLRVADTEAADARRASKVMVTMFVLFRRNKARSRAQLSSGAQRQLEGGGQTL
jgi:hypothetical protein